MRAADRSAPPILGLLLLIVNKYLSLPARALSLSAFVAAAVPAAGLIWQSGDSAGEVSDIFVVKKNSFQKNNCCSCCWANRQSGDSAGEKSEFLCVCVCVSNQGGKISLGSLCARKRKNVMLSDVCVCAHTNAALTVWSDTSAFNAVQISVYRSDLFVCVLCDVCVYFYLNLCLNNAVPISVYSTDLCVCVLWYVYVYLYLNVYLSI